MRDEEKAENEAAVIEAQAGLEAVNEAIEILEKFYKTASGEKVDLEFVQQNPFTDAPKIRSFKAGEEYTGGGESGGILGMLDVIKSDFERTLSTTDEVEATAQKEYEQFMGECDVSIHEKQHAMRLKTKQKDDDIEELVSTDEDLHAETEILKIAIQELLNLQPTCVNTAMTFNERVARREREIEALKDTLCMVKHQEKGLERDAAASKCGVA